MPIEDTINTVDVEELECKTGVSDSSQSLAADILNAAVIAVAGYEVAVLYDLADKQYDIAKQYLDIAKWWRDFYNTVYRPWEDKELEEAWAIEYEEPLYDAAIGRARTYGRLQFRGLVDRSLRCTSEYCTGLREALLKDVLNAEASTLATLNSMGYRNERAHIEARNDVLWQRKYTTVQRGRDMVANNIQFSQLSFGIFGDLGQQAGKAASGALRYLGYAFNKNETQFPTVRTAQVTQRQGGNPGTALSRAQVVWGERMQEKPEGRITSGVYFPPGSELGRVATNDEMG